MIDVSRHDYLTTMETTIQNTKHKTRHINDAMRQITNFIEKSTRKRDVVRILLNREH